MISKITRYFNNKAEEKQKQREDRRKSADERFQAANRLLSNLRQEMLSKQCPFRGKNCSSVCVNFLDGHVFNPTPALDSFGVKPPICRLWGNVE